MKKSILEVVHESAQGLKEIGAIDEVTMREFDALCLPKIKAYTPSQIKKIRRANNVSQGVFALYLNTGLSTVQKWEQGVKRPNGPSSKLIDIVDRKGLAALG